MNKKAIELSVNFIVMLILAIVVFGFGLFFVRKVFTEAGAIKAQLSDDAEKRVELLLDRGERVAFPITNKDVAAGDVAIFGLGILNVRDITTTFDVNIACTVAIYPNEKEISNGCSGTWTFPIDSFDLKKNEKKVIPIVIQAQGSKPKGTYGFTVTVTPRGESEPYGGAPQQIYVNII